MSLNVGCKILMQKKKVYFKSQLLVHENWTNVTTTQFERNAFTNKSHESSNHTL